MTAYYPVAIKESKRIFGDDPRLRYADKAKESLEGADALLIVSDWKAFRSADLNVIKRSLKAPVIIDWRNLYDPTFVRGQGFSYLAGDGETECVRRRALPP